MHHHHPLAVSTTTTAASGSGTHAHQQRRRKKRPNYGTRTVEVHRGYNGFGFTISGQQPCRLSCIVNNSPADHAGLRAGDFLISVNGLNVSKLPHETVVQLIGNSFGSIRMQIAENYYSDSSDEENAALMLQQQALGGNAGANAYASHLGSLAVGGGARAKPRFLHHKTKMHRLRNSPQKKRIAAQLQHVGRPDTHLLTSMPTAAKPAEVQTLRPLMEDLPLGNIIHAKPSPSKCQHVVKISASSSDVANVSAMVRVPTAALEYRAIVGYLGTIEMPKQISHSSKLQTVRSCIRKLRQEKRQPTTVLMTILPDCLRLQSSSGATLASYASERLNYVSSSSESENRFFGLVTSAVHTSQVDEEEYEDNEIEPKVASSSTGHISISNSCHVFVIDIKLCEHPNHIARANEFRIQCTNDPISNLCLEFPNNSEYVVNLIRSMYTMRILPPATRHSAEDAAPNGAAAAHSPQPSNHSEISTTTSNSDSGIGFHNDCTNISDRILVVDFPGALEMQVRPAVAAPRPMGIFNNFAAVMDKRLTVRAMPDPKTPEGPNLLASLNMIKSPASSLTTTRSCDDVLTLVERSPLRSTAEDSCYMAPASMDDISLHSAVTATMEEHLFLRPTCNVAKQNKRKYQNANESYTLLQDCYTGGGYPAKADKLSPKVFGLSGSISISKKVGSLKRQSLNFDAIEGVVAGYYTPNNSFELDTWSSLQDLPKTLRNETMAGKPACALEIANSEPDMGNRALPSNVSPFRRAWGQSSFRTPRTDKHVRTHDQSHPSPLVRRTASMTASDNDVYIKSMDNGSGYIDDIKRSHQLIGGTSPKTTLTPVHKNAPLSLLKAPTSVPKPEKPTEPAGVSAWASSFERLIDDPAGLHTFAEFLKKEFSAENIYFWTACERFRHLDSEAERAQQARAIFAKHLASSALEPVNVDSQARNLTEEKLQSADRDIFAHAQKQIFNLMKFDSYQRFIRSDLYKSCLEAEEKHHALPYTGEDLDELLKTNFHQTLASKLKKSASNAEDRRRKSLLPWHRKTRSKSRDRAEGSETGKSKLPQLSSSSLKIPSSTQNSMSDIHSSRSSLSSFDALPAAITNFAPNGQAAESACTLCRVILSDGATTIVQTRLEETVGQLVERLLEKRGLTYQFYDVVANGSSKSIDLQHSSQLLAGKEVLIEQRVAFKLDLPDPKVISVKSKPKKQLHEVIRPILHKYNYTMEAVQVLMRDTHAPLDLSLPVTVADGQRLQIVLVRPPALVGDYQNGCASKFAKPALPKSVTFPTSAKAMAVVAGLRSGSAACVGTSTQSTLDEITNKVFNELMQGKVEAHAADKQPAKERDLCSLKSEDCASETSSLFERMRRRDPNIPGFKIKSKKKSTSSQHSEETTPNSSNSTGIATTATADVKKPIIAKLKAGVKLQVTERVAEKQDELLEGLKRAQLARLEDQRGTEINFELPDFLKNKENLSVAASKLRKVRANLSPINKTATPTIEELPSPPTPSERPQPAPRLSITNKNKNTTASPMKIDEELPLDGANTSNSSIESDYVGKGPPPLPPKPKVLPIKPSNWGVTASPGMKTSPLTNFPADALVLAAAHPSKIPIDINRKAHLPAEPTTRCAYLEEPSSSFV